MAELKTKKTKASVKDFIDGQKNPVRREECRELNRIMPCDYYERVTDDDLKAIFAFLRTLPPTDHLVSNTDPPTPCARCGGEHGLGEKNEAPAGP